MFHLTYVWAKVLKKVRLSAIRDSDIHPTAAVEAGSHVVRSTFGRHSFCGYDCEIYNCDIGAFTSIANGVSIGGGAHPMNWVAMSPVFYEGSDSVRAKFSVHKRLAPQRTKIGSDVWIGRNVLIKQGVTVGNGVVIGMGSVVTRDVEDFAVVAGAPARLVRKRFDNTTIRQLQEIKWWEFDDERLHRFAQYVTDPARFITEVRKG